MKNKLLTLAACLSISMILGQAPLSKKRILILSSKGGGGHTSATNAIKRTLGSNYDFKVIDLGDDIFKKVDPFYWVSGQTGQDYYNNLLETNSKRSVNALYYAGKVGSRLLHYVIRYILRSHIKDYKPHLVISVIPMINGPLAEVAHASKTPYLLIPTDFGMQAFLCNVHKSTRPFTVGIGLDLPEVKRQLADCGISCRNIRNIGFPIRPNFFEEKDQGDIKKRLGVPEDKPVIMLVMGATGSSRLLAYIRKLQLIEQPFHIVVCVGRSTQLKRTIEHMQLPAHISCTAVDISEDISDIMAISDLCISKPGTVTFAETMYMNLPVLLDNIDHSINWERFNFKIVRRYGFGGTIDDEDAIAPMVARVLSNEAYQARLKKRLKRIEKNNFMIELPKLVTDLIG